MRWLDDVTRLVDMSFCKLQEIVKDASMLPSMERLNNNRERKEVGERQ